MTQSAVSHLFARVVLGAVVAVAPLGASLGAQQALPIVKKVEVRGGISTLILAQSNDGPTIGSNMVVFEDPQGAVFVDAGLPVPILTSMVRKSVEAGGVRKIEALVVTHWHPDHSGGIAGFSADVPVYGHRQLKARLSVETKGVDLMKPGSEFTYPAQPAQGLPTNIINGSSILSRAHEEIVMTAYPGRHTDGDDVVNFDSANVVGLAVAL